jgi:glycosyltransferase involved in cell wall biosynthesis
MSMKIIAVVPALNEEKNIGKVVKETKKYVHEVIVVDDGSSDNTRKVAEDNGALVVKHLVNMGLGFSLMTGSEAAVERGADIIVTIDADGQHDPAEIPKIIGELVKYDLDIVIASRPTSKEMPLVKKMGNTFLYLTSKALFNVDVKDTQSGFRAFTAEALEKLRWTSSRYPVASEIVKNIGKNNLKYKEVPIKTVYHDVYKGTTIIDGLKIFLNMILWRLKGT